MKRFSIFFLLLLAVPAFALDVREPVWGFGGKPVPGAFNLFSVFVSNPSESPFVGEISLYASELGGRVGAKFIEPLYLAPNAARWVQFFPFLERDSTWNLNWGSGPGGHLDVSLPKFGAPAQVLFDDPEDPLAGFSHFKIFPENLFPPTVAATDGLTGVVLDHAPRWEPTRREAFLDWIRRGGTLHLLQNAEGKFPVFIEDLALLNSPLEYQSLGSGRVFRHALDRRSASEDRLRDSVRRLVGDAALGGLPALKEGSEAAGAGYGVESSFFRQLASLTRPKINWGFIYLLAFAYLGAIGPWHYFWGRKKKSSIVIGALAACVIVFGAAFIIVGRRGYGEVSTVHSIAWARSLGGGRLDVMQWSTVFVTHGDTYSLRHPSAHNLYAAVDESNSVNGSVTGSNGGEFDVDIPRYSSRGYLHCAVLQGDDPGVHVIDWEGNANKGLSKLSLATGPGFPKDVIEVWVRDGFRIYQMTLANAKMELSGTSESQEEFFDQGKLTEALTSQTYFGNPQPDRDTVFKKALRPLMSRITGLGNVLSNPIVAPPLLPDQAQLFIFAKIPEGFHPAGKEFARGDGCVLYDQLISKPHP